MILIFFTTIRKNITPIGDGNKYLQAVLYSMYLRSIRKNITPIGDGNLFKLSIMFCNVPLDKKEYNSDRRRKLITCKRNIKIELIKNKKEYNSDRRRKLFSWYTSQHDYPTSIRKNITPIGDGNNCIQMTKQRIKIIRKNITPIGDGN